MPIASRKYRTRPRPARATFAVFAMLLYLFSGALHAACHLDVTTPAGEKPRAIMTDHTAGHPGKADLADHHCHGCFSISIPAPAFASALLEPLATILPALQADASDLVPSLDPPPPKPLT